MSEIFMQRMTWTAYRDRLAAERPVVLLPVGATEQHGPHLPMGTDALLATAVAADVARAVGGIVAPPLNYGYKSQARSGGGQCFPGTTSLDGAHLTGAARDVIRELARHGVGRLVVVDGHYENQWFLTEAIELALREPGCAGLRVLRTEYWDLCPREVLDQVFPDGFPGFALEHAALIETSLMLHYHPELVELAALPDDGPADFAAWDVYPQDGRGVPPSGVLAPARGASAGKGALLAGAVAAALAEAVRRELGP